jgi:hypothetical protein
VAPGLIDLGDFEVVRSNFNIPFTIDLGGAGSSTISGHVEDRVLKLLQSGRLAFETRVVVSSASVGVTGIDTVIRTDYGHFATVVAGYEDEDAIVRHPPTGVSRSQGAGTDVSFVFGTPIGVPQNNNEVWNSFVVVSDPSPLVLRPLTLVSDGFSKSVLVWSPVPEPQTWLALAGGIGLLICLRKLSAR